MGEYKFIENGTEHDYQLICEGRLWNTRYDIYLDCDTLDKLELIVQTKDRTVKSSYKSSLDANKLLSIIPKAGIKQSQLMQATLPRDTNPKIKSEWEHIVTWLSVTLATK